MNIQQLSPNFVYLPFSVAAAFGFNFVTPEQALSFITALNNYCINDGVEEEYVDEIIAMPPVTGDVQYLQYADQNDSL